MKQLRDVTLELPIGGNGRDYAGAIALAIAEANCAGDHNAAAALVGLMSFLKLPPSHNPDMELGPWLSDIAEHH